MRTWARVDSGSVGTNSVAAGNNAGSDTAVGDGTPRRSGVCYAGELFGEPARSSAGTTGARGRPTPAMTVLSGYIDPVRDLLPAVENAETRLLPRITDAAGPPNPGSQPDVTGRRPESTAQGRHRRGPGFGDELAGKIPDPFAYRTMELAGWIVNPGAFAGQARAEHPPTQAGSPAASGPAAALAPVTWHPSATLGLRLLGTVNGRHAANQKVGTPADGFHRSLTWSGPIGDVVAAVPSSGLLRPAGGLIRPIDDLTTVDGLRAGERTRAGSTDTREQQEQGALPAALVSARGVDLASSGLGWGTELHTVRHPDVACAMFAPAASASEQSDLQYLPGAYQEQAGAVPNLEHLPSWLSGSGRSDQLAAAEITRPLTRIAHALLGSPAHRRYSKSGGKPVFAESPELSDVTVTVLDELAGAVPEREYVTLNPYPMTCGSVAAFGTGLPSVELFGKAPLFDTASSFAMALPVLSSGVPEIADARSVTRPMPAIDMDGKPAIAELNFGREAEHARAALAAAGLGSR